MFLPPFQKNLIRIKNPDTPIYRVFRWKYLQQTLEDRHLCLTNPSSWDDPFENILMWCAITYRSGRQEFIHQFRKPMMAQCWSLEYESDAAWRIYSTVDKCQRTHRNTSAEMEGIKVRTTARKLLTALWQGCPKLPAESCFLGRITYLPQEKLTQRLADIIGRDGTSAFAEGGGHAESLLVKRKPFEFEQEVRLIYVEHTPEPPSWETFQFPADVNDLFEEMILDPRVGAEDERERRETLASLGYQGPVSKSGLYQRCLFEIAVDRD